MMLRMTMRSWRTEKRVSFACLVLMNTAKTFLRRTMVMIIVVVVVHLWTTTTTMTTMTITTTTEEKTGVHFEEDQTLTVITVVAVVVVGIIIIGMYMDVRDLGRHVVVAYVVVHTEDNTQHTPTTETEENKNLTTEGVTITEGTATANSFKDGMPCTTRKWSSKTSTEDTKHKQDITAATEETPRTRRKLRLTPSTGDSPQTPRDRDIAENDLCNVTSGNRAVDGSRQVDITS
mmetsp:Transcript_10191/g.23019  ORF Transcript_10191/g.23019 Transcript_10191/m.23019 type:complete len:233 (-) Transcript_10191:255-953(-)